MAEPSPVTQRAAPLAPEPVPAPSAGPPPEGCRAFPEVLDAELEAIRGLRRARGEKDREPAGETAVERAHDAQLLGLSFSGGGIRSATFNLGVAAALARLGLLRRFDYFSINSGGGYLGGWLLAWIRRAGMDQVTRELAGPQPPGDTAAAAPVAPRDLPEPEPVSFLRRFSNYLTPKVGAFSADTWTLVATYLRNLLLNQSILVLALAAMLLTPWVLVLATKYLNDTPRLCLGLATGSLGLAIVMIAFNVASLGMNGANGGAGPRRYPGYTRLGWVQGLVIVPLLLSAWLFGLWIWSQEAPGKPWALVGWLARAWPGLAARVVGRREDPEAADWGGLEPLTWAVLVAVFYGLLWCLACVLGFLRLRRRAPELWPHHRRLWGVLVLSALPAGAVGGLLLWLITVGTDKAGSEIGQHMPWHLFHVNVWNPPGVVLVFLLTGFLHIGLTGRLFVESYREWMSRLGAWLMIYGITWIGLFGTAIYGPVLVLWLETMAAAAGAGWVVTTLSGVLVGKRSPPREGAEDSSPLWRRLLLAVAPQVFIVGMLVLVALGLYLALTVGVDTDQVGNAQDCGWLWPPEGTGFLEIVRCQSARMWVASEGSATTVTLLPVLVLLVVLLSWRVDINQFSMHLFYRNRLIRAYLGASHRDRQPQPFTAFDPADDLPLASLAPPPVGTFDGPLPVLNTTLNLVAGQELAWQERKAASFVFTPLYSGFEVGRQAPDADHRSLRRQGYRPTAGYRQSSGGLSLGTAMGISGAAVSPSMGAQSKAALAFLLTLFNVRLGWWLGNPRDDRSWDRMGPNFGLLTLLSELFGFTDETSRYVYLSDGGHFDNLGLYELVRRRCRYIVLTDAGADPDSTFGDLGGAIRKCRTDFGVDIEIDVGQCRRPTGATTSAWHCAVGQIRYDRLDPGAQPGTLVYLKASLTGDEPEDVLNYAAINPLFPHEPTTDQWFGESQFESYRKLGEHITTQVFQAVANDPGASPRETLFVRLREAWCPPCPGVKEFFTRHTERLGGLLEHLRTDPSLAFLTPQLYPDWGTLTRDLEAPAPGRSTLPNTPQEVRSGLYFCTTLIQLLENVYLELDLEKHYDHPDNRGWMNMVRFWSGSAMFRVTWAISAAGFGARFQTFAERRFGLALGEVRATAHPVDPLPEGLSPQERQHAAEVLATTPAERLFLLELWVPHAADGASGTAIPVGFALCRDDRFVYFRIRSHLRRVGLARRALQVLIRDHGLAPRWEAEPFAEMGRPRANVELDRFDRLVQSVGRELATPAPAAGSDRS
jgi:hypothetical protein